jgi:hypothetical protein
MGVAEVTLSTICRRGHAKEPSGRCKKCERLTYERRVRPRGRLGDTGLQAVGRLPASFFCSALIPSHQIAGRLRAGLGGRLCRQAQTNPRNHFSYRTGRSTGPSRSIMVVSPPLPVVSRHSVRIRLSASVRTPNPTPPMITPTPGAGRSSTILHRFVVGS